MNPLTAAQERAREEYEVERDCFKVYNKSLHQYVLDDEHIAKFLESIVAATWNDAIEAAENVQNMQEGYWRLAIMHLSKRERESIISTKEKLEQELQALAKLKT